MEASHGFWRHQYLAVVDHSGDRAPAVRHQAVAQPGLRPGQRRQGLSHDLGNAVKGFRSALSDSEKGEKDQGEPKQIEQDQANRVAEGEARKEQDRQKS